MAKTKTKRSTSGRTAARKAPAKRPARKTAARRATAAKVKQAARLYESFHGQAPRSVKRVASKPVQVAMAIGRLEAVIYQTPDGKLYKHEFRGAARPVLAASHDGRKLVVQGGRYRMTWRGIVDKRK